MYLLVLGIITGDGAGALEGDDALVLRQVGAHEILHVLHRGHARADLPTLLLRFALSNGPRHHDRQIGVLWDAQLLEKLRHFATAIRKPQSIECQKANNLITRSIHKQGSHVLEQTPVPPIKCAP